MGNLGGAEKSKNENFIVKYKKEGVVFEILVDFENLEKFKEEKEENDVYDVVFDTDIYFDIKKAKIRYDFNCCFLEWLMIEKNRSRKGRKIGIFTSA